MKSTTVSRKGLLFGWPFGRQDVVGVLCLGRRRHARRRLDAAGDRQRPGVAHQPTDQRGQSQKANFCTGAKVRFAGVLVWSRKRVLQRHSPSCINDQLCLGRQHALRVIPMIRIPHGLFCGPGAMA